jgi:hypothetical protein
MLWVCFEVFGKELMYGTSEQRWIFGNVNEELVLSFLVIRFIVGVPQQPGSFPVTHPDVSC